MADFNSRNSPVRESFYLAFFAALLMNLFQVAPASAALMNTHCASVPAVQVTGAGLNAPSVESMRQNICEPGMASGKQWIVNILESTRDFNRYGDLDMPGRLGTAAQASMQQWKGSTLPGQPELNPRDILLGYINIIHNESRQLYPGSAGIRPDEIGSQGSPLHVGSGSYPNDYLRGALDFLLKHAYDEYMMAHPPMIGYGDSVISMRPDSRYDLILQADAGRSYSNPVYAVETAGELFQHTDTYNQNNQVEKTSASELLHGLPGNMMPVLFFIIVVLGLWIILYKLRAAKSHRRRKSRNRRHRKRTKRSIRL